MGTSPLTVRGASAHAEVESPHRGREVRSTMTPFAVERHDGDRHDWLGSHADDWVAAGLITPDQAASLQAYEAAHAAPVGGRLGPLAEAAAYVGAVLALIGGAVGLGPEWRA